MKGSSPRLHIKNHFKFFTKEPGSLKKLLVKECVNGKGLNKEQMIRYIRNGIKKDVNLGASPQLE